MRLLFVFSFVSTFLLKAQIVIDNNPPYNNTTWLVDNILLGGGVTASNHAYQGESAQVGWFNATNTNLGIDSGIVMCTGDIYALDPVVGSSFPILPNVVTDPDLLTVANSVPGMIGQSFSVSSINDVATLEFDFIPTSDSLDFRYVFGSQEYFAWENTSYNDVFGFFLSGPGIAGPYLNGAINLAVVPNTTPPLPITISSINSVTPINQQYFVDNQNGLGVIADADGFTTVLTARALVQCGEVYHIRLTIADGSDQGLSSYVWLEAGSFSSPLLDVVDDLGIDSTIMNIPCNSSILLTANGGVGASYQWFDSTATVIGTDSFLFASTGLYWIEASSFGCPVMSDTLRVVEQDSPSFDFGLDYTIPCNTFTTIDPVVSGGLGNAFYTYSWSNNSTDSSIIVNEGSYWLQVDDGTGCFYRDTINITEDIAPTATINGGGSVCDDGTTVDVSFSFNGLLPWNLTYTNGTISQTVNNIPTNNYLLETSAAGQYDIEVANDVNDCIADILGASVDVIINPLPVAQITPNDITLYIGDEIDLTAGEYTYYEWYNQNDTLLSTEQILTVTDSGVFYIWVEDENGCTDISELATVRAVPLTQLFIPKVFTPNDDDHNEFFVIKGLNVVTFNIQIFTRWGELVFESNSIDKYWDGSFENNHVSQGSYYYSIEVLGKDRKSFSKGGVIQVIY